jgi:hypothetical protein
MKITKGEYCQFSLRGRIQFLNEFGKLMGENIIGTKVIRLYKLSDFYVEVFYNRLNSKIEHVEPVKTPCMRALFSNSV